MREARRAREAAMPFIMITVLIDMLAIGLIIPVLPALVGGSAARRPTRPSGTAWSPSCSAWPTSSPRPSSVRCPTSTAAGRCCCWASSGLGLNFFATAMATAMWMLLAARVVGGAMQANAAVANAYVADITAPEHRARRFGMLGAMQGLGFIVGPVMGGLLGRSTCSCRSSWPAR
jgi:DHA1 family tetracycline resistance protein-like MFS transporter